METDPKQKKTWSKRKLLGWYTLVFALFFAATFWMFPRTDHTFVWNVDGGPQYVPYLAYIGQYLREAISGALHGDFTHKMIDFSIGMGSDVGAVFRPHPLDFLSVFVPVAYTEVLYHAIMILRMYLAGLSFLAFGLGTGRAPRALLAGSMVYVFCGYTMTLGIEHTTFLSALIVLPLLLLGARRALEQRRYLLFAAATCLGFYANYYFMYMCTIAMAVYVLLLLPDVIRRNGLWPTVRRLLLAVLAYLIGFGMAGAAMLPIGAGLGASARLDLEKGVGNLLLYGNRTRYYRWFLDLIAPHRGTGSNTYLNYLPVALPALAVLFGKKWRSERRTCIAVLLCILGLLVPAVGYGMAGFSNVNNRWCFIFSFVVGYAVTVTWEDLKCLKGRALGAVLLLGGLYLVLGAWQLVVTRDVQLFGGMAELVCCLALLLSFRLWPRLHRRAEGLMLTSMLFFAFVGGYLSYNWHFSDFLTEFIHPGIVIPRIQASSQSRLVDPDGEGFFRADTTVATSTIENYSVVLGYHGTAMYNSLLNGPLVEYLMEQENNGLNAVHRIFGLDGRSSVLALANVRDYLTRAGQSGKVPYGYLLDEERSDEEILVYRNTMTLPFGYTYDSYILREDYEALSALEKQEVLLESALLEAPAEGLTQARAGSTRIETVPAQLPQEMEGISLTSQGLQVQVEEASFALPYERREGYECYVRFSGFTNSSSLVRVDLSGKDISTYLALRGAKGIYSLGKQDYLVSLGYCDRQAEDVLTVSFRTKGSYHLSGISFLYVPMEDYPEKVAHLAKESLEQLSFQGNTFQGQVDLTSEKLMTFSVPYSSGWQVLVDGEKQPLLRVNTAYAGVLLPAGHHTITLRYASPLGKEGIVVSVVSCLFFVILAVVSTRKRRKGGNVSVQEQVPLIY